MPRVISTTNRYTTRAIQSCHWCGGTVLGPFIRHVLDVESERQPVIQAFHDLCFEAKGRHSDPVFGPLDYDEYQMTKGVSPNEEKL